MSVRRRWAERAAVRRLPPLLPQVLVSIVLLLGVAWTTTWPPGPRQTPVRSRLTVEIPSDQRPAIRTWEAFFACYGLVDERIMRPTLEAGLNATGSTDFPQDGRIDVDLSPIDPQIPPSSEVQAIMNRARDRRPDYVRQCAGG